MGVKSANAGVPGRLVLAFKMDFLHDKFMLARTFLAHCRYLARFFLFFIAGQTLANSLPVLSDISDQRTFHSTTTRPIPFTVFSQDPFVLSVGSSNTTLVPLTNITCSGSSSNWMIVATPFTNVLGTTAISVTASNQFGTTTKSFLLTVADFSDVTSNLPPAYLGAVKWVDYDNDGYLDLFLCGYDTNFLGQTRLYHNNHDRTFSEIATPFPAVTRSAADWADFDGDGFADLLINGVVFRNMSGTNFAWVTSFGAQFDAGGSVAWSDVDNDGKPDILLSTVFGTIVAHNSGDGTFPLIAILPAGTVSSVDYNNDGWNDILVIGNYGNSLGVKLYRNTGTNSFVDSGISLPFFYNGTAAWGDYNNDGWGDLLLSGGAETGGTNLLFLNNHGVLTNATTVSAPLRGGSIAWSDFDNDGNLDFFSTGLIVGCCYQATLFHNAGTNGTFFDFGLTFLPEIDGAAVWGDYDNDGAVDLFYTGGGPGMVSKLYHNDGAMSDNPPSAPTGLTFTLGPNSANLSWNASTDPEQSGGLTYNIRIGTSLDAVDVVSPLADLVTGFLRIPRVGNAGYRTVYNITNLAAGTYYCSVQAIDHSFKGSKFSDVIAFTLPAPVITNQPESQVVNSGTPVTFSVGANGADPKFYQWSFNGIALTDRTNPVLTINSAAYSDQGVYAVTIKNQYGTVVSSNADLTVLSPPSFSQQPVSAVIGMSASTNFTGMAIGSLPISYQWYFNGNPLIEGGHDWRVASNNLTIISTLPEDAGEYFLVASNDYGSVTSSIVYLTVQVPSALLNVDFGSVTQSLKTGRAAVGETAADFWNFYNETNSGLTNLTLAQHIPTETEVIMTGPRGVWTNSNPDPMFGNYLYQNGFPGILQVTILGLPKGNLDLLFYGYLPQTTDYQLFVDGLSKGSKGYGGADFTGPPDVNSTNWIEGVHYVAFRNVAINTNSNVRVVVGGDPGGITIAGMQISSALAQPQVPLYWIQPKGGVYSPGGTLSFNTIVTGQLPIQYQWYRDGVPLTDDDQVAGANSNILTIVSSSTNQTGNYSLVCTNPAGSSTSTVARVFVGLPPSVTTPPHNQTNLLGSNVTFTATIAGTPPLSYHWRRNGANLTDTGRISGSLTDTLTLTNLQTTDAGQYSVVVTNEAGIVTSTGATLTVWVPPSVTQQPQGKTVLGGSNVNVLLIGNATGTTPLRFQWFKNESPISGAVSTILSLPNVRRSNSGAYTFVVTNVAGAVTSAIANLVVHIPQKLTATNTNGTPLFKSSDMDGQPLVDPDLSRFFLQTSSNLFQWTTITNGLSYTNGEFQILPTAMSPSAEFYRVMELW